MTIEEALEILENYDGILRFFVQEGTISDQELKYNTLVDNGETRITILINGEFDIVYLRAAFDWIFSVGWTDKQLELVRKIQAVYNDKLQEPGYYVVVTP